MNPNTTDADNTPSTEPVVPTTDVPAPEASATPSPIPDPAAGEQPVATPSPVPAATDTPEPVATPSPVPAVDSTAAPAPAATPSPIPAEAPAAPASPFFTQSSEAPIAPGADASAAAAAAPLAAAATVGTGPQAPNGSNKKVIKLVAIIGGALLLAIIGVVAYFLLTSVSKEDYRDAARQYNKVSLANSSANSDVSSLSYKIDEESDTEFDSALKEAEDSIAKLKTENDALGKLKAVRVGEGGKLYGTFNDKLKANMANGSSMLTSVKNLRPALKTCGSVSAAADEAALVTALKTCSSELNGVTDIPNADFKAYIEALKPAYADFAVAYEQMSAIADPYGSQYEEYKAARDKLNAAQKSLSAATTTFTEAQKKTSDALSVKEAAETLRDFLNDKQKQ